MHESEIGSAPIHGSAVPERFAYGVPEVAILLNVSERYVWTLIDRGELVSFKIGSRRLVARDDALAFIARLRDQEQRAREASTR